MTDETKFVNKVIYGGKTLIDLTGDTVTADKILKDFTAHDKSGAVITGECAYDVDSANATASVAEILKGKTAYARGTKLTGTMPDCGSVNGEISEKTQEITISHGYHDGSGKVFISTSEQAKIIAANIKNGVEILGVTGTCEPSSDITAQKKEVTPSTVEQSIIPDEGTDYLSEVTVKAISYVESENSAGGTTVMIAG